MTAADDGGKPKGLSKETEKAFKVVAKYCREAGYRVTAHYVDHVRADLEKDSTPL